MYALYALFIKILQLKFFIVLGFNVWPYSLAVLTLAI